MKSSKIINILVNLEVEVVCEGQEETMLQCFNAEEFCEWSDTNENKTISVDQGDLFDFLQAKINRVLEFSIKLIPFF